jgi:hypothetical protein
VIRVIVIITAKPGIREKILEAARAPHIFTTESLTIGGGRPTVVFVRHDL